ncbi:MAG: carboxypeptidase-like regulatory domain-containing protein, partial [Terracidiphilus sp.]
WNPQVSHNSVTLPGLQVLTSEDWSQIATLDSLAGNPGTAPPPDTNRFRYVETDMLEGPDPNPIKNTFSVSDGSIATTGQTESKTISTSMSAGAQVGIPGIYTLQIVGTLTMTWTYSTSLSQSTASSDQESITLGTSTPKCFESIDIYTDLMYHTFTYVTDNPAACSSGATATISGTVTDSNGSPLAHELVTIKLADGSIRRINTSSTGRYGLSSAVAGSATVSVAGQAEQTVQLSNSHPVTVDFRKSRLMP